MSFLSISATALEIMGWAAAVTLPVAVIAHGAETLMIRSLWLHSTSAPSRGWKRVRRLVLPGAAASGMTIFGAGVAAVLGLAAAGRIEALTSPEFWLWFLGAAVVLVLHAWLTRHTAKQGAGLVGREPWVAQHDEERHLWRVLAQAMPLRSWDVIWLFAVVVPASGFLLLEFWRQGPGSEGTAGSTGLLAVWLGLIVVVTAGVAASWLLNYVKPRAALALMAVIAASSHASRSDRLSLAGRDTARLLEFCARRRVKRLPASLRDPFLTGCGKLAETLRMADLQQHTRPEVADISRCAIQHAARIAYCIDAYDGTRVLNDWLAKQRLLDMPTSLAQRRRFDPAVQVVGKVAELWRNLIFLAVSLGTFVLAAQAWTGLSEFIGQLR